ncbi:hypothetical protein ACFQ58_04865 [Agromyces sp. NPDC056523]|uniref:hypothetical protein n=1 Tax=Agromyces sp. NPDC056523 TaxID=3345850 RepID=UPI00366F3EEC
MRLGARSCRGRYAAARLNCHPVYYDEVKLAEQSHAVPFVLIGARHRDGEAPSIMPDERAGVASVIDLLVRTATAASGNSRLEHVCRREGGGIGRGQS